MKQLFAIACSLCLAVAFDAAATTSKTEIKTSKTAPKKESVKPKIVETPEIEAVTMFRRVCVETKGDIDQVNSRFADLEKSGIAKKLTADDAKKATGHDTKAAWVMQSPSSKQKLMASEDADGSCNVYVNRGDATAIRAEFKRLAVWDATELKSKIGTKTKTDTKDGTSIQLDYYEVLTDDKDHRPMLILSSSDKTEADTQHLMTYKTIKSSVDAPK